MKKKLSLAGISLVAMGLFMGSCVSKKKYMETQSSLNERYRADSAQWAERSNTMQQNIATLETQSASYQKQADSFRASSMNYQKRWEGMQTTYTQQASSTEQLHQQIHAAIDQYVEASNVETRNGKIYINLEEKAMFAPGTSKLSAKGKETLDKLADVLASNDNVEVDIITTAAYYTGATTTTAYSSDPSMKKSDMPSDTRTDVTATDKTTDKTTDKVKDDRANLGDSAFPTSGAVSKTKVQDPNKKATTAKPKATTPKGSVAKTSKPQGDRSVTFKSSTAKKTAVKKKPATNWNLNVARSTAIVRELTANGLPQARIVIANQNSKGMVTNDWAATNRGFQVVVSPKMDSYYQMMQEGQGTTGMR